MKESARDKFTQINSILGQRGQLGLREGGDGAGVRVLAQSKDSDFKQISSFRGGSSGEEGKFL